MEEINQSIVQAFGPKWLRLIKTLPPTPSHPPQAQGDDEEPLDERDDEALSRNTESSPPRQRCYYDIIHSPSYAVPVLYVTLPDRPLPLPEGIHQLLLASSDHPALPPMQAIGPLGALTTTDHPTSGVPAYFVHPCRTAEAMESISGGRKLSGSAYLLAWIGLVGGGVGLDVPVSVAQRMTSGGRAPENLLEEMSTSTTGVGHEISFFARKIQ